MSRRAAVFTSILVLTSLGLWTIGESVAQPTSGATPHSGILDAQVDPDYQAELTELARDFPKLSDDQIHLAVDSQDLRRVALEATAQAYPGSYSGAWFDIATGTQHVAATTAQALGFAQDRLTETGAAVDTRLVYRSKGDLDEIAATLDGRAFKDWGFPDAYATFNPVTNALDASVSADKVESLQVEVDKRRLPVRVSPRPSTISGEDVCTSVYYCGIPLRSGIAVYRGANSSNQTFGPCSIGYALKSGDPNDKWFTTAGHCANDTPTSNVWTHTVGSELGRTGAYCENCSGNTSVDVSRIKISSTYVLGGSFGWMYNYNSPEDPITLNNYAVILQQGDVVCLKAIHVGEISDRCGTVDSFGGDPAVFGETRVANYDACPGDSGGAWFYTASNGIRTAYGSHARSTASSCHGVGDGAQSWFTTILAMNNWNDGSASATLRVITR